jgi:hypothetical protein
MKIKKILLYDNADEFYTDLIEFERDTTAEEIVNTIQKCKKELEGEYTNEDIYKYLDKEIGIKTLEFLDYERFDY